MGSLTHQKWVCLSTDNIFCVYPAVLSEIFAERPHIPATQQHIVPWVVLPSDVEWKTRKYYQLVDKQRQLTAGEQLMPTPKRTANHWETRKAASPGTSARARKVKRPKQKTESDLDDLELTEQLQKVERHLEQEQKYTEELQRRRNSEQYEPRVERGPKEDDEESEYYDESYNSFDTDSANITYSSGAADVSMLSLVRPAVSLGTSKSSMGSWPSSDIAKAARLLAIPPMTTVFIDELEMRRVYSLVYDVFRYKNVMNETLTNVRFFSRHSELQKDYIRVWLLLFDLYHRQFSKPSGDITEQRDKLYEEAGVQEIEKALWSERIRLAAETSRIRIKNNALHLSQLLPLHLRDERVAAAVNNSDRVSCWVNCFRSKSKLDLTDWLRRLGLRESEEHDVELDLDQYKFDKLCPRFMVCRPKERQAVAQSWLVRKHHLVLQDRAFCLGPMVFGTILDHHELGGCVLQSHVNTPRTTAYLANILAANSRVVRLLAFGAGEKKSEYDKYFNELGITNTTIYAHRLVDTPPDAEYLEHVVAVFACPPNSYSGVKDPVDLACSRGGDLSVLQALTEAEVDEVGRFKVAQILREQRSTLKFAMSRPQIQFVLYETHSSLQSENAHMVERVVEEMNRDARIRHAELMRNYVQEHDSGAGAGGASGKETPAPGGVATPIPPPATPATPSSQPQHEQKDKIEGHWSRRPAVEDTRTAAEMEVPLTDIFHIAPVSDLPAGLSCEQLLREHGCYLANLQRKEVTRLDHKYMIKMAEARGLFGDDSASSAKKTAVGRQKRREDKLKEAAEAEARRQRKAKKSGGINVERLAASTHTTRLRKTINNLLRSKLARTPGDVSALRLANQCTRADRNQAAHSRRKKLQQVSLWRQAVRRIHATKMALVWADSIIGDLLEQQKMLIAAAGLLMKSRRWMRARRVYGVAKKSVVYDDLESLGSGTDRHRDCCVEVLIRKV